MPWPRMSIHGATTTHGGARHLAIRQDDASTQQLNAPLRYRFRRMTRALVSFASRHLAFVIDRRHSYKSRVTGMDRPFNRAREELQTIPDPAVWIGFAIGVDSLAGDLRVIDN